MRVTQKDLDNVCSNINDALVKLNKQGRYGVEYCYGHTNIVYYADPNSTGTSDVCCGLTKSEARDILRGICHALNAVIYR